MAVFPALPQIALAEYFSGRTIKALLLTPVYVFSADHVYLSDLPAGSEVTGGSYVAGGVPVTGVVASVEAGQVRVTADDVDFPTLEDADVAGVIFYDDTGTPSTSALLAYVPYGSPVDVDGQTFTHEIAPEGWLAVTFP